MAWTDAMRQKAAETRAARKAERRAKADVAQLAERRIRNPETRVQLPSSAPSNGFNWETAPLTECINRAADMKREYERVAQILVARQNPPKKMWTCWSEEHRKDTDSQGNPLIPKSVLAQCLKRGEDGKYKFRDDGRFVVENGVRTLKSAFCCNFLCYAVYQKNRVTPPARER